MGTLEPEHKLHFSGDSVVTINCSTEGDVPFGVVMVSSLGEPEPKVDLTDVLLSTV